MAYEQKPGTGTIFKVENKTSENYPDYKGKIKLADGTLQEIALWVRGDDRPYFSAKIQNPYVAPEQENKQEDDLPF